MRLRFLFENVYNDFVNACINNGFSYEEEVFYNDKCLTINATTYPTLISKDGNVKIGIEHVDIIEKRNEFGQSKIQLDRKNQNIVAIQGIFTPAKYRNKGYATQAMNSLIDAANQSNTTLKLEPAQIRSLLKSRNELALSCGELASWYKTKGFKQVVKNSDKVLVYVPNATQEEEDQPEQPKLTPQPEQPKLTPQNQKLNLMSHRFSFSDFLYEFHQELIDSLNRKILDHEKSYVAFMESTGLKVEDNEFYLPIETSSIMKLFQRIKFLQERSRPKDVELAIRGNLEQEEVDDIYLALEKTIIKHYKRMAQDNKTKDQLIDIIDSILIN